MNLKSIRAALLGMLVVLAPYETVAQDATGKVAGNVTDPSGAAIVGAQITVTNRETKVAKQTQTDRLGFYQVLQLPIGNYTVTAEATGFSKTELRPSSALEINQTLRVDIKLEVGAVTSVVTVDSQGSPVETENSTVGGVVTGQAIFELPLNGRNTLDLVATLPGVTATNPDNSGAGGYSIGGGRTDSVTYLLDGGLNNDLLSNGVIVNPNPDAIGEFRVLESTYGAEYGRNAGGIVSVVTKSGTNSLHGTVYDYARNTFFDANDFFNNENGQSRAVLNRHQYGATIGGPIVIPHVIDGRNKLFFFFSYQGQKQSQLVLEGKVQTFTPAEANGDFSQAVNGGPDPNVVAFLQNNPYFQGNPALAAQGIIDPTKIDPVAQAYFKAGLIPTSASGFLYPSASAIANNNEYLGKLDFLASNKDTISGTFTAHDQVTSSPYSTADVNGYTTSSFGQTYSGNVSYIHTFTASLLNEARATAVRNEPSQYIPPANSVTPASLGINVTPDLATGPPILFFDATGLTIGYSPNGPTFYANTVYAYYDNLSWTKGRHSMKYGFYFSPYQNNTDYSFFVNGSYDFYGPSGSGSGTDFADFLFGLPDDYFQAASARNNIRSNQYAGYAQDQWKLTKNFTLNLGVRYEYSEPKYDTQGRSFDFIPGDQSTRFPNAPPGIVYPGDPGAPKGVNFPDKNDWAPRVGFAWDIFGDAKTSLRGGFGVFYDVLKGEDNLQFNGSPPFYAEPFLTFNGVDGTETGSPNYLSNPFGTNSAGTTNGFPSKPPSSNVSYSSFEPLSSGGGIFLVDPHLRTPYVYQYSLNLERQLPAGMVAEAGYVGYDAHKLTSLVDINPFVLGTGNRVYNMADYLNLDEFQNVGKAYYDSLQLSLQRRFGDTKVGNIFFQASYTWSHEIDNVSGFRQRNSLAPYYNTDYFRASGDTDLRQVFALSGGWTLPFDRAWQSGPKFLTKGWTLYPIVSYHTGFPLDVTANITNNGYDPGPAGDGEPELVRADVVGTGVTTYNPRNNQTLNGNSGNFYFNPANLSNTRALALDALSQGMNPAALIGMFTEGTLGRNSLRGPGFINTDLSLSKHTNLFGEKLDAELRLDAFNVFNHANFSNPDTNIDSPTFGQVTTTTSGQASIAGVPTSGARVLQVALHFRF